MTYSLYISDLSPYSFKAAALLGYAGVPCEVRHQNVVNRYAVLKRLTGDTMVPVLRKEDWAINDSTRIAQWATQHTERELLPGEEALEAICWLIEEFADEWVMRWVEWSRWFHDEDATAVRLAIGDEMACGLPLVDRSIGRISEAVVREELEEGGVRESNRPALRQSRDRLLQGLENHLEGTYGYVLGEVPTVADFALYGQLEQYRRDPTGGERLEMYPAIAEWLESVDRMRLPHPVVPIRHGAEPSVEGLEPLLAEFFGVYWRVLVEIHRTRYGRSDGAWSEVELTDGTTFEIRASGYLARRVEFVLGQFDRLVAAGESVAVQGLELGDALDAALRRLAGHEAGREAIRAHDRLAARVDT